MLPHGRLSASVSASGWMGPASSRCTLTPRTATPPSTSWDTFAGVYKKLTGKEVTFEFPVAESA